MKQLTLKEIQEEELICLKKTTEVLDKYNLKYYLWAGTLLGAVRHHGFIPWDDDVDLLMSRPDYDKLLKLILAGKIDIPNYEFVSYELGNGKLPFLKVINKNIIVEEKVDVNHNLWIDIFPVDGVPSDEKKAVRFLHKIFVKNQLYCLKLIKYKNVFKSSKTIRTRLIKIFIRPFLFFMNEKRFMEKYLEEVKKYSFSNSKYVAGVSWIGPKPCYYDSKVFAQQKRYQFENQTFSSFKDYDYILSKAYGDYMELPPAEKRYTHSFDAFYKDDLE